MVLCHISYSLSVYRPTPRWPEKKDDDNISLDVVHCKIYLQVVHPKILIDLLSLTINRNKQVYNGAK